MKKTLTIIMLLITACTKTPQQKAEILIKHYLDSTLNDPQSYQNVSFGYLIPQYYVDTLFVDSNLNNEYFSLNNKLLNDTTSKVVLQKDKENLDSFLLKNKNSKRNHSKYISYYKVGHIYRAKNSYGTLILHSDTFYIEENFKKVYLQH